MAIMRGAPLLPFATGKLGNVVLVTNKDGSVVLRERVVPRNPRTPGQTAARGNLGAVSQLWGALDDEQRGAWESWAEARGRDGYRAFVGLAAKWRRVNGTGSPPSLPPTNAFFGDAVALTASAGAAGTGTLVLTASRANAPGVTVEILVQTLAAAHRKAKARDWRSKGFVAFAAGALTRTVPLPKGAYAVVYRFVETASGQETATAPLGKVTVA